MSSTLGPGFCSRESAKIYNSGMQTYSIGQLAKAARVPTSTLRYYEREGLLKPDARSGANYRMYTQRSLERLEFICSAQAVGLSLNDVEKMLDAAATGSP